MAVDYTHPFYRNFPRYMGLPIRLRWEGWESNTFDLQQNGWEVSVSQSPSEQRMMLALHHRQMRLTGISPMIRFDFRTVEIDRYLQDVEIPIIHISPQIQVITLHQHQLVQSGLPHGRGINWGNFTPVDAAPGAILEKVESIHDLIHFQPIPKTEEIIIPEKNVSELLQEILKKQEPEQKKYWKRVQEEAMLARGRARETELHDQKQVHAQIITLRQRAA